MTERKSFQTVLTTLGALFEAPDIPADVAEAVRVRQLASVTTLVPAVMMAQLISGAVLLLAFWGSGAGDLLGLWATVLCFACGITMLKSVRRRSPPSARHNPKKGIERISASSAVLGGVWALVPAIVVPYSDPIGHMALGVIMVAICFAGGFLLSRIPSAAFAFVLPVTIGHVIGMQLVDHYTYDLISILALVYIGMLSISVQWTYARYIEQLIGEAALKEKGQVISLLLRDFEETTSDWLWQTDENGCLERLPASLDADKQPDQIMSIGQHLCDAFEDCDARSVLKKSLLRRTPFHDLMMPVQTADGAVWWTLTGKPVFEGKRFAGFRGVASDVTASKASEDRIAHLAHYDTLTGLPNRVSMLEALESYLQKDADGDQDRALLWLDLDDFKWVNDTLGHPAGDELLRLVADRITQTCMSEDMVARLGGDEFAITIARKGGLPELEAFATKLTTVLAEPYRLMESTVRCSASIGVRPFDALTVDSETLLKQADLALYEAKRNGRAAWCLFTDELEKKARERRRIEHDLQSALDNGELAVYFQPQIAAGTGQLVGCEALLRWHHPERGIIYPGDFIEAAEDSGLITRLGDWVIRSALEQAKRLPDDVRVAVNISPLQVHSANLLPTIMNALAANGLAPGRLDLEITESVLMTNTDFTLERLHQLKQLGVHISLDDFGTGFSSLSYLRNFPFDKIKIDKSFIGDLENSEDSRTITRATLGLAKALGLKCTAEGVETVFQSHFLKDHGCDELQGFLIGQAVPLEELDRHLDANLSEITELDQERDRTEITQGKRPQRMTGLKRASKA